MILQQITSPGLAHNSYYIGSGRAAAVVDPRRDCDIYLELARDLGQQIICIFETHRNEDYIPGSVELSQRSGADVFHGSKLPFLFGNPVKEGDKYLVGNVTIEVLETPGHTLESISLVVRDNQVSADPYIILTGDALFAGDVGRTDLIGEGRGHEAAALLYDSITGKILPLGDGVLVYPAHGAGSVCGVDIADHQVTTIGYEKAHNPFLRMGRDEFIRNKEKEHHYLPPYFRKMEELNLRGPPVMGHLPDMAPLSVSDVKELASQGAQILDIRSPTSFGGGHIRGSLSIWRDGLASFMGWFLDYRVPIVLIDDFNLEIDLVMRNFVRLGYDNLKGYLAGGFPSWFKGGEEVAQLDNWSVHDLDRAFKSGIADLFLLDVRDLQNRRKSGHIKGDHHVYVGELPGHIPDLPPSSHIVTYCDAGYKGCLAASILKRHGFLDVTNVLGGMTGWIAAGLPVEM